MKESFVDVKNRITKDEFLSTLQQLDRDETIKKFNLSLSNFSYLVHFYEAEQVLEELKQKKRKLAYQKKAEEKEAQLKEKVSKAALIRVYIEENHSLEQTALILSISQGELLQLIKLYDCKKPKTLSKVHSAKTKEQRYGSATYNNREQAVKTCLDKYGVDNPSKVTAFMETAYDTKVERYGEENVNNWVKGHQTRIQNSGSLEQSYKQTAETLKQHCLEIYGVENAAQLPEVKAQIRTSLRETFQQRYGVDCYWLTDDAVRSSGSKDSSFNKSFSKKLDELNIPYTREVRIGKFIYDFQVGNYLVEINPTPTHNVTWSPFSTNGGIEKDYHQRKSINAVENNYQCIHIWDWDDQDKIIQLLLTTRNKIFARKCVIRDVGKLEAKEFINHYHLQGYANDSIRIGLYYNDILVSIMTFGKPRYNKNYQYELIRYCSSCTVVGGADKIFNYFLNTYSPSSIISYCDRSKFQGQVYEKLGFNYKTTHLSSHWFNVKTKEHILDSLLRSRGFDQLFGTNYGKGTSNRELIIQHGFVEIVDSGQSVFVYHSE